MTGEFDAIEAPAQTVTVGGKAFTVSPLTVERMPGFTRALRPLIPMIGSLIDIDTAGEDPQALAEMMLDIVSEHGERLIDAVAYAVAPDVKSVADTRARIGKLNTADFILLALPAMKVNADFFAQSLLPAVRKAMAEARASLGTGLTPAST